MDIRTLNDGFAVSDQIMLSDIETIQAMGFGSIICNRPNRECPEMPDFEAIQKEAEKWQIQCRYLPVETAGVNSEVALKFAEYLTTLPKPVLAYCRSGMRSISLWALSEKGNIAKESIIKEMESAGYIPTEALLKQL